MVRADEDTIEDDEEYGDDDKLRDEILGVMEELCDTLNDSLNFKKVVCMKREKPTYLVNRLLKRNLSLLVPQTQDAIWKNYLGTNLAYVAKEGKTTVKEQPMKIKAIMLGLALMFNLGFSG